jgi:hypothetical protein
MIDDRASDSLKSLWRHCYPRKLYRSALVNVTFYASSSIMCTDRALRGDGMSSCIRLAAMGAVRDETTPPQSLRGHTSQIVLVQSGSQHRCELRM